MAIFQRIGDPEDRLPARQHDGSPEFDLWLLSRGVDGGPAHNGISLGDYVIPHGQQVEILSEEDFLAEYEPVPDALEAQRAAAAESV